MQMLTKIDSFALQHVEEHSSDYFKNIVLGAFGSSDTLINVEKDVYDWVIKVLSRKLSSREALRHFSNQMRKEGFPYDTDMILSTLISEHYSWGKWKYEMETLKQFDAHYTKDFRKTIGISENDVLIFKLVSKFGCEHCKNIWVHKDGTPRLYLEEFVRSQPSNYDKKPKEWQPQIGPIHFGCTESGIEVARLGVTNLVYPNIFERGVNGAA